MRYKNNQHSNVKQKYREKIQLYHYSRIFYEDISVSGLPLVHFEFLWVFALDLYLVKELAKDLNITLKVQFQWQKGFEIQILFLIANENPALTKK